MGTARLIALFSVFLLLMMDLAMGAKTRLRPRDVHTASNRKTNFYIRDGLFVGGDRAINDVVVTDIRRGFNRKWERIVVDLEGNRRGESVPVKRPPYYHVAVSPNLNRLVVTVWGTPKLAFNAKRIRRDFKKSPFIQNVELLPLVEADRWSVVFNLKRGLPVEVFELGNPLRIIVDIRAKR